MNQYSSCALLEFPSAKQIHWLIAVTTMLSMSVLQSVSLYNVFSSRNSPHIIFLLLGIATITAAGWNAYLTTHETLAAVHVVSKLDCKVTEGTIQWIHSANVGSATVEESSCASGKTKHMFWVTGFIYFHLIII